MNNKNYSTLQLVLNGQLYLYEPEKLVDTTFMLPAIKCFDPNQIYWQSQMENQSEKMPLVTIGNSHTCSVLLNTNYNC